MPMGVEATKVTVPEWFRSRSQPWEFWLYTVHHPKNMNEAVVPAGASYKKHTSFHHV